MPSIEYRDNISPFTTLPISAWGHSLDTPYRADIAGFGMQEGAVDIDMHGLGFTDSQQSVLFWIATAHSNAETGNLLYLAEDTVKSHAKHAMAKIRSGHNVPMAPVYSRTSMPAYLFRVGAFYDAHPSKDPGFTPAEIPVIEGVVRGRDNKRISQDIGISPLTVKSHLGRIRLKVGTGDRTQLALLAVMSRAVDLPELSELS